MYPGVHVHMHAHMFLKLEWGGSFVSLGLYLYVIRVRYIHRLLSLWCRWMLYVLVCFIQINLVWLDLGGFIIQTFIS